MKRALLATLMMSTVLLAGCSSGGGADSDGDTIRDSTEKTGWIVTVDYMDRRVRYTATSDPNDFDSDDDGVSDFDEFFRNLDPRKADTDGDGLTDCQEVFHSNATECADPDFDGQSDGGTGTDPRAADSDAGRSVYAATFIDFVDETGGLGRGRPDKGDGISDGEEWYGYTITLPSGATRFVKTDPLRVDSDSDLLDDGYERHLGTDPLVQDSDGDGCDDGKDVFPTRTTRYDPGLRDFTLLKGQDGGTGAKVRIQALLVDDFVYVPGEDGTFNAQQGQSTSLQGRATDPVSISAKDCNYNVQDPWARIEILAAHHGVVSRNLDIQSATNPEGNHRIWWNLREDTFSWSRDGPRLSAPFTWEGADGRLRFEPQILHV